MLASPQARLTAPTCVLSRDGTAVRLREQFGDIDVHLFDQLLRGRLVEGMKVLDAGCGEGRNLVFFLRAAFDVWAVDESRDAIERVWRVLGLAGSSRSSEEHGRAQAALDGHVVVRKHGET